MEGLQHTARAAVRAVRSTLASMRNRRSAGLDRENGVIASRHTGTYTPSPPVCQRSFFLTDASDETGLRRRLRTVHLRGADGKWTVRDDVWVRYQREEQPLLKGPLGIGYAVYGGTHHFGAELQEQLRGGFADSAGGAGYDRYLAVEALLVHFISHVESPFE